jgi:cytochrome c oxidase subunit 3
VNASVDAGELGAGALGLPSPVAARAARRQESTAVLGMVLFLASWAMLFAALFFAYGLLRARALAWPPADLPPIPKALPSVATVLLAAASVAIERARRHGRAARHALALRSLGAAAGLGAVFLALQLIVWTGLWQAGLHLATGPYASVFYGLTVFHGVHVVVGVAALGLLAARALRAPGQALPPIGLRLWALYFHMVGIVWAAMYVLLVLA